MDMDRDLHLEHLTRDMRYWNREIERLEREGRKAKAAQMKSWIKSAQRLADRLKELPST